MAARDVITFGFSGSGASTIPMLGFSGGDSPIPPTPTPVIHQGGIGLLDPDRKLTWDMLLERARRKRDEEEIIIL